MTQQQITFENLPAAMSLLLQEVNSIKILLSGRPADQEPTDKLLTVVQAAEFLTLAKPTLYSMISRQILPNLKRGKRVYFKESDLVNYLEAGRRNARKSSR